MFKSRIGSALNITVQNQQNRARDFHRHIRFRISGKLSGLLRFNWFL